MKGSAIAAAILALACVTARPDRALTVRNGHVLAFDGHGLVLFGGADDERVTGETWTLRGGTWRLAAGDGPGARTFAALARDDSRGEVVLFGGHRVLFGDGSFREADLLGDTWLWNGRRWKEARPPAAPPPRAEAAVAYDSARRRVVLFGGYAVRGRTRERLGDTWEWDGVQWTRSGTAGPSARNGAAMCYDESTGRTLLFGGNGPAADTWAWDGSGWRRVDTNVVPGRYNSAMAFDVARRVAVRFGGWDGQRRRGGTWTLHDGEWRLVSEAGPSPRNHAAMTWDPIERRIVLFGGHDGELVLGDAWSWDGSRWVAIRRVPPRKRVDNRH